MIISCPSCETQFNIDEARLAPDGKKVRCSKCGHVWLAAPGGQSAREIFATEQPLSVPADASPSEEARVEPPESEKQAPEAPAPEKPAEWVEPVLSARDPADEEGDSRDSAGRDAGGTVSIESGETAAGLTDEQRAKLTAARQKKPRRRFWPKVLVILIIVASLLLLAYKMMPLPGLMTSGEQPPADVGKVEAKPVPADPAKGGHIVGDEPPAKPAK